MLGIIRSFVFILLMLIVALYVVVHYFKPAYTEVGGINPKSVSISLREHPDLNSKKLAKLPPAFFARLSGPKNKWNYFYSVNKNMTVFKKDFKLGYSRIFKQRVLRSDELKHYEEMIVKYSPWLILGLFLAFFLLLMSDFLSKRKTRVKPLPQAMPEHSPVPPSEQDLYLLEENRRLKAENEKIKIEGEKIRERLEGEFLANSEVERKELEATYNNDIARKKEAITSLKIKFDRAVEQANILGVDLNNSNISNLVKGRLFELFAATIWHEDNRATIEDWTPDKGINDGIYVESNGNPDFLVSLNKTGKMVAVECKYRGKMDPSKDGTVHYLNLDKEKVFERYKRYEKERGLEVLLLFGVMGSAESPDVLYLIPLDDIYKIKHPHPRYAGMRCTTREKIKKYKIGKYDLVKEISAYAK